MKQLPELSPETAQFIQASWPIALMGVIFYFLLYRPQKKSQKERANLLDNLMKEDKVVTIGGMHGTIVSLTDKTVILKVSEKVEIKFSRTAISHYQDAQKNVDNK